MIRFRAPAALLVLALGASGFSGCNLFKPEEPEKQSIGAVIIPNYSSIDSTLATMSKAIAAKGSSGGLNAYMGALAEPAADGRTFVAVFDPATLVGWQGSFTPPWLRSHEQNFYFKFASSDGSLAHELKWIDNVQAPIGDPVADTGYVVFRTYDVTRIQTTGTPEHLAYGQAEMSFFRSGQRWVMWRWVDHEVPGPPVHDGSFGLLRLRNQ